MSDLNTVIESVTAAVQGNGRFISLYEGEELVKALEAYEARADRAERRVEAALHEMDHSTYGDPEVPFRMRAHLDPDRNKGQFEAVDLQGSKI